MRINGTSPAFGSAEGVKKLMYQVKHGTPVVRILDGSRKGLWDITPDEIIKPPLSEAIRKRKNAEIFNGLKDSWGRLIEMFSEKNKNRL